MPEIKKEDIQKIQVSSVTRNDKNFGKQHLFDGCEDTCWTSGEGIPQWILVEFKNPHVVTEFSMQFQGGFVGRDCKIELKTDQKVVTESFYPDDVNSVQKFKLTNPVECTRIKYTFNESTDFFGRIVVYAINIYHS